MAKKIQEYITAEYLKENLRIELRVKNDYGLGDGQRIVWVKLILADEIISEAEAIIENQS